jgi:pimeloyl-ACP methyl ester carboxylesterase
VTKAALLALGVALLICGLPFAAVPALAAAPTPQFRAAPCPFPGGEQAAEHDIDCGYVTVPEHRDRPSNRTIDIAVAIAHGTQPGSSDDPVVFLNGGPGDSALVDIAPVWAASSIRERHDLVLLDQRGTGYSRPALPCRALDSQLSIDALTAEQDAERVRLATTCLDEYRSQGIDVTAYTTRENAADVDAVREALGLKRWSLYGISYGTRLALEVMRTHASTIRAAVLDSPYPPQARPLEDASARFERAMVEVLTACREDPGCAAAYPNVGSRLGAILSNGDARLDREYPWVPASYAAGVLNGELYTPHGIATIPVVVDGLERGNAMLLRNGYFAWTPPPVEATATGMHYSVECHDRAFDVDEAAVAKDRALHSSYGPMEGARAIRAICGVWGAQPPSADEVAPVASDVPTLVLVGQFDPVTPPSYAAGTAFTLGRATIVEMPGLGHAVSLTQCGIQLRNAFLADQTAALDRSCVDALPLATFSTEIASVPGLPYLLDGVFARSNPTIGQIGIMLMIALGFASALVGWPLTTAAAAIRGRRARRTASGSAIDEPSPAARVEPVRLRLTRLARLTALLAIGADVLFVIGLARALDAMPVGSFGRSLGVPREDRWIVWVADAGAALAVALAVLVLASLVRRIDRRRSRAHLAFVAFGCVIFSTALAYYRILGI